MRRSKTLVGPLLAAAAAAIATSAMAAEPATAPAKIRIVSCETQVPSHKRGLCVNEMSAEDYKAIAPGVSWVYNWNYEPGDTCKIPDGVNIEFVPTVWGNVPEQIEGFKKYMKTGAKPRAVLAINEPNLKGQAFITPKECAELYKKIKVVADEFKIPVVGPNMSLGSAKNDSIVAEDPIDKKKTTYTFMVPYLKAYMAFLDGTEQGPIGWHGYGEMGEFKWAINQIPDEFGKKQWVTELAYWKTGNPEGEIRFMIESVDIMEKNPSVEAYAWFKERVSENRKLSVLDVKSGKLTPLGQYYVNMPSHEPDVFYQLPGKLDAAKYLYADEFALAPSKEKDTLFEMIASNGAANGGYNINVTDAGEYTIELHARGNGQIMLMDKDKKELAVIDSTNNGWHNETATVKLGAGSQVIRLYLDSGGMAVTSLTFKKK